MKWLAAVSGGKLKDYLDEYNHAPDYDPLHGTHDFWPEQICPIINIMLSRIYKYIGLPSPIFFLTYI